MNIEATRKTAFFTGIWSALGFSAFDVYERLHPLDALSHNLLFLAIGALFLFAPFILFITGSQYLRFGINDLTSPEFRSAFLAVAFRGLCWFFGGAIGLVIFSAIESYFAT
ncbi:MAG TPA: hypothetical protein VK949_09225 [Methylotenera sp.]|nr:hypothetical protein [Methylotenera sp.]